MDNRPKLIRSLEDAIANIITFNHLLDEYDPNDDRSAMAYIINNLASFRAWYAFWDKDKEKYLFAPSKYIGYQNLTPEIYDELRSTYLDGRKTEKVLSKWFDPLTEYDDSYEKLTDKLEQVFATHDKSLNSKFRLNIIKKEDEDNLLLQEDLVELIYKVYLSLSEDNRETFKQRISNK